LEFVGEQPNTSSTSASSRPNPFTPSGLEALQLALRRVAGFLDQLTQTWTKKTAQA